MEGIMQVSPLTFAAEFEQAATVSAFEDHLHGWQAGVTSRYGYQGIELMWEYENGIFEIENGNPAHFVVFH